MNSLATESLELITLMVCGGLLAVAGFWLMLREGPGGGGATIGIGNLQVSASSAGFAVFFSGLATFSAPIVAPNSTHTVLAKIAPANLRPGSDATNFRRAGGHFGLENEPQNDQKDGATVLELGQLLGGTHSGIDVDWYRFDLRNVPADEIEVEIAEAGRGCRASFFDEEEQYLGLNPLLRGKNELQLTTGEAEEMFVKIDCIESANTDSYTITFNPVLR